MNFVHDVLLLEHLLRVQAEVEESFVPAPHHVYAHVALLPVDQTLGELVDVHAQPLVNVHVAVVGLEGL